MSEEKKNESVTDQKISRRSMLKWSGILAAAVVVGVGAGYEANQLLRPITTVTQTATQTVPLVEEQVYPAITTTGSLFIHVRNGRISWVEPIYYGQDEATPWTITAAGKNFSQGRKLYPSQVAMATRRRVYVPTRMQYPMKRVGFQPGGVGDVSNRGKGEFVRITWDEALDTIAKELQRIKSKYGNSAFTAWSSTHREQGTLHGMGTHWDRFFGMYGGYTQRITDGVSWTGWIYGTGYVWNYLWSQGLGEKGDIVEDTMLNSKLIIHWSTDAAVTNSMYRGHDADVRRFWYKELGIRQVSINPIYTDTAAVYCDQWIPIYQGTDTALALAIANVWIKEGTYDKQFVATHTVGFDKFSDYVLGKAPGVDGGIDRTPAWAQTITGVDAQTTTNLAREWASKPTFLLAYNAGACRISYAHEWTRLMALLTTMQGIGKPGVNICDDQSVPFDPAQKCIPGYAGGINLVAKTVTTNPITQVVDWLNFPEAILTDFKANPPLKWHGGQTLNVPQDAFKQWTYPSPGNSEIKMIYLNGASSLGASGWGAYAKAYKNPKIEFFVVQNIFMEQDAMWADIVLPINTNLEHNDVSEAARGSGSARTPVSVSSRISVYQHQCIEPLYESKTDWQVFTGIADRLGFADKYTEGNSEDDWLRKLYELSSTPLSWEAFKAKGYYVFPLRKDWPRSNAFRWFYNMPANADFVNNGLKTPSGKIEFYSQMLADFYGENSNAIGTVPKYFPDPEGRSSPLAKSTHYRSLLPTPSTATMVRRTTCHG